MAKTWLALLVFLLLAPATARAEDGYRLWLRYDPVEMPARTRYGRQITGIFAPGTGAIVRSARDELQRGLSGLLARQVPLTDSMGGGTVTLLKADVTSSVLAAMVGPALDQLEDGGYIIQTARIGGRPTTMIAANSDRGLLYGAFAFLRLIQTRQAIDRLNIVESPKVKLRMLNHWDNLDRWVERGYAGLSLWDWQKLPVWKDPRYTDYARANASIGINGTVLNNVNASPEILTPRWLQKVKALADVFRPWGIRIYLSANFSAPIEIGGLKTADPLDPKVRAWWKAKTDEIYRVIPDFGGFLVKANSEGQPGPQDYKRSHADGANMFAEALAPHGGIVIWRAFVYSADNDEDRVKQAYDEFKPLDGKFAPNVILQVKNGPLDFQPREPFHPLFGAMPKTPLAMEVQITKEYLGFATHLAFLGTMWEETLASDTYARGPGSTVAKVVEGTLDGHQLSAMAGVANTGNDRNWSGSQFDQANWYAFGRLAWDPQLSARAIAEEWTRMTWGSDPRLTGAIVPMMMGSRQAVVDYMTPLGLAHQMGTGHHYGPAPWVHDLSRPEWNPVYYNRADAAGIGFDRTATGSNAVAQYAPPVARRFASLATVGDDTLLWFHHVPWDYRLDTGRTLWDELVVRYTGGVDKVREMRRTWASLAPLVDPQRYAETASFLAIQEEEALWWRDASIAYFQSLSHRPLPAGTAPPVHPLGYYEALRFPYAPGQAEKHQ